MISPNQAFIRKEMLPQSAPPSGQSGAVKWLRENLFSGPVNTILTLIGLYLIYAIIAASLPWMLHGVWTASSLGECRDIITATFGEGATGACWAILNERWHQFIFGFFPQDAFWRPILTFGLLFVALAPVLFADSIKGRMGMIGIAGVLTVITMIMIDGASIHAALTAVVFGLALFAARAPLGKLIWFTMLFPTLGFLLLWGGSIWGPIGVLIGFGIMGLVFNLLQARIGVPTAGSIGFLVACVWWLVVQTSVTTVLHKLMPWGLTPVDSDKFGGFLLSFVIGVGAISASLPIGILLALGRQSNMPLVKSLCVIFIEFVRGVPLITMLFTASLLLQYFLPPQTKFDLILRVIILVTLFASAYIAEVIRGGLAALPKGQYEAANALGLDYWQAERLIIMPQALKISIPGIVGSFIGLFKDTTLVALVGLADPLQGITKIVRADIAWKGVYWEPYLFVGLIFFIFCFSMSRYAAYLEHKLKTDHR